MASAFRFGSWDRPPTLDSVDPPEPSGAEVLLTVDAAGVCQSDLHVIDGFPSRLPFELPFTLGHEVAGTVAALGPEADGIAVGDKVAVYGPWGCGFCTQCAQGRDNYCDRRAGLGFAGMGLGRDGGMADFLLAPSSRYLEPIGDLDPVQAAPLTDAGLTPFHAVSSMLNRLDSSATALVIGVGGLGHLAVQILRALSDATIFAVDPREGARELAESKGAALVFEPNDGTSAEIRKATDGIGIDVVFDFVGSSTSIALGVSTMRTGGALVVVGSGGGEFTLKKFGGLPQGAHVYLPFWGTRSELPEVLELARRGQLEVAVETFPLADAPTAFDMLRRGVLQGRAVLVPDQNVSVDRPSEVNT